MPTDATNYFTVKAVGLPDNPTNNFFQGFSMDSDSHVTNSIPDSKDFLTHNYLGTSPNTVGPANRLGYLEYVTFTPNLRTNGVSFFLINEGLDHFEFYQVGSTNKYTYPNQISEINTVFNVIPEPSSAALFGIGTAAALALRRRTRKNAIYSRNHEHARNTGS